MKNLFIATLLSSSLFVACTTPSIQPTEQANANASKQDGVAKPALRDELLEMRQKDQAARTKVMQAMKTSETDSLPKDLVERVHQIDKSNTKRLQSIIKELGRWPGTDLVGAAGADAAWLLAQHADQAPERQEFFLEKLLIAVENGQAPPKHYAYLVDRVRLKKGEPQLYGTQFDVVDGDLQLKPVEDPQRLDERREEMGLEPIDQYLKRSREMLLPADE